MTRVVTIAIAAMLFGAGCGEKQGETYRLEPLPGPGSPFHGVHGLRFDDGGRLYAASVIGQSIFRVDTESGTVERVVAPPEGMADDLAFAADGTMYWTAIEDGIVYARAPDGTVRHVVDNMKGVNAISFSPDRQRLFFSLVFYGDALYELDLAETAPPRLIAEDLGGLNAFQVGNDGMIYGPLVFGGRVVRIDPDTGETTTVSDDFESPGAVKLDFKGSAYVLDGAVLKRLDLATGATTGTLALPDDADNLAIDSAGGVFVSMAAPNAIAAVDIDAGRFRYIVGPSQLNSPAGLGVASLDGVDTIYVGDLFGSVKRIDGRSGLLVETPPLELFQPAHVSISGNHLIAVSQVFGTVQRLDRETFEVLDSWEGFSSPGDALEDDAGNLIVADTGTGRVLRVTGTEPMDRSVIAERLSAPTGLALANDGTLYVTETDAGRLLRIPSGRAPTRMAEGLLQPEGVAVDSSGNVLVLEVGGKQISRFDSTGVNVVATGLPVGLGNGPSLYRGLAFGTAGIYFSSDVDNTVYKLTASSP